MEELESVYEMDFKKKENNQKEYQKGRYIIKREKKIKNKNKNLY